MGNESHREMDKILISEENQLTNDSSSDSPLVDAQPTNDCRSEFLQIPHFTDNDFCHSSDISAADPTSAADIQVITPYPKYYQRQKKGMKSVGGNEITVPNEDNKSAESLASIKGGDEENQNSGSVNSDKRGDDLPIALRKGTQTCVKPIPFAMASFLDYQKASSQYKAFLTQIQEIPIPKNPQEALNNIRWKEAMDEEMKALLQNETWEIVELPRDKKIVGCRWVYTLKCKPDGSLDRYKARLVARGYTQTYGIDYRETFAPVAKINTIRILLSLAVNLDWPLYQYDIKNAFLHGDLNEEIYMNIPPGYEGNLNKGKVCKLKKALYGLKQSHRAWFGKFTQAMKDLRYKQCNGEHTLFFKIALGGLTTILIVYVDDIIISGNNLIEIRNLEVHLHKSFRVKQLG